MVTATPTISTSAWFPAIDRPAQEFGPTSLNAISGQIPPDLNGRYFANGTGRLQRGDERVGHWFDGDGAILGVNFSAGEATGTYRYVKTEGFLTEEASGKYQYAGYGMGNSGPIWERFRPLKNAANTSVLAVDDRLLALWEGAVPHALDLDTLETNGLDTLGVLSKSTPFSAHPKRDPKTGDIYNFGSNLGAKNQLFVFRCDRLGTVKQRGTIPLSRKAYVHDFILAGSYLVFVLSPVTLNVWPIMFKQRNFCDCLEWKPNYGTEIIVVDRQSLQVVSSIEAEPWYQWHFGNGFVSDDGTLTFDTVRYPDFQTNEFLRQVPTGVAPTYSPSTLWQVRLDPNNGKLLGTEQLCDLHCEFPTLVPHDVGQPHRYTYLAIHPDNESAPGELFRAIGRFDRQTGTLMAADLGPGMYVSEPIYVPQSGAETQTGYTTGGWLLTTIYNSSLHRSELWVFDSDRLNDEPIVRLGLPSVVPHGFHGTWQRRR